MNLQSCTVADLEFQSDFSLAAKVDGQLTAVVGFFDVEFLSVLHKKSFSTSPYNIPTHWKQTVFLLETPISVVAGKLLSESARSSAVTKELHDAACVWQSSIISWLILSMMDLCTKCQVPRFTHCKDRMQVPKFEGSCDSKVATFVVLLWLPCVADADIMFLPCDFFLSFYLFFIPHLISAAAGWMSTIV